MSSPGALTGHVVTVTANPAVDQTVWVPGFCAGEVNRVIREQITPGGKGVNVAAALVDFGVPVFATGFLGIPNSRLFEAFFDFEGIAHDFVGVSGTTRTNVVILDDDAGATTDVNFSGFEVNARDLEALERIVSAQVAPNRWVVLAGSLPAGAPAELYGNFAEIVHAGGGLVAVDSSGPAMREAMAARPDLVKPNWKELEELTGRVLASRDEVVDAASELSRSGIGTVVISLGGDGALFVRGDDAVFASPVPVHVASTVGAGDAMVAGTIAGTLLGLELSDVASLATAFSAVAIAQIGPHLEASAIAERAQEVSVEKL